MAAARQLLSSTTGGDALTADDGGRDAAAQDRRRGGGSPAGNGSGRSLEKHSGGSIGVWSGEGVGGVVAIDVTQREFGIELTI